jgi:hypothetical protein
MNQPNETNWSFNLKVFINAYNNVTSFKTDPEDWNVRYHPDGTILIDNHYFRTTSAISIQDDILDVDVSPWGDSEVPARRQSMDLLQSTRTWRHPEWLTLITDPAPEALAFQQHLLDLGYEPPRYAPDEDDDYDHLYSHDSDYPFL